MDLHEGCISGSSSAKESSTRIDVMVVMEAMMPRKNVQAYVDKEVG